MARKYLDTTGLTALWAKITDKVTAVQAMLNSAVSILSDAIAAKVSKSGDTMTGGLWMNNTDVYVKDTDMSTTTPSSNMYGNGLYIKDAASTDMGYLRAIHQTNGNYGLQLEAHRVVNNTNYYNTVLLGVDSSGNKLVGVSDPKQWRNALGLAAVAESGSYNDLSNKPTIPDISGKVDKTGDPTIFKTSDMPQGAANLNASATTHRVTVYRNGLSIPYQMDNPNDGGILRVRGTSESNCILELGTWDDSGSGETIQFNYYPTTSQITPTHSVSVPKASGTIALTSQLPSTQSVGFTRSHASVSYTEGLVCNRFGNVVTFAGYFSCGATIAANVVLYSGLPKPAGGKSIYFTWSGYDFFLHPTDGTIRTNSQIISRTYVGTFTYVCA